MAASVREQFKASVEHIGTTDAGSHLVRLLCELAPTSEGAAPEWIHICPYGPFVAARDGRVFQITDVAKAVASSELPMLVDWEHNSERWSGETRAACWIEELKVVAQPDAQFARVGVWGRAAWNPKGKADVESKEYRFLSPVLVLDGETRDVLEIVSVALTNRPALVMHGLFREQLSARFGQLHEGAEIMKPETLKLLLAALGLKDGATDEQILEAARAADTARKAGTADKQLCADLTRQLGEQTSKTSELEAKVKELQGKATADAFAAEVKSCLDEAGRQGKITPAQRPGFEKMCSTPEQFASFKESVLPNLVVIGAPAGNPLPPKVGEVGSTETLGLRRDVYDELKKSGMSDADIKASNDYLVRSKKNAAVRGTEED